jgi:tripartite-type tricarboxylate transporter receptor subunit TctC
VAPPKIASASQSEDLVGDILMTHRRPLLLATCAAAFACAAALPASAQTAWPSKPIRIVVPYGPGSSPDVLVRLFSDKLGKSLGQTVIVENRAGAGGNTGTDHVAKAAPDGYTFLVSTNGPLVYSTVFNAKLPYDPFKDLAPVTLAGVQPNIMVDLPEPDGPHTTTRSPRITVRLISCST